jgi:plastocyanin
VSSPRIRRLFALGVVAALAAAVPTAPALASHSPSTYRVQLDATPPPGEPWAFLLIFPAAITVHQGDVIDAAFASTDTPHTASFVPTSHANAWRQQNQAPGGPYDLFIPDLNTPSDEGGLILNPAIAGPSSPGCGTSSNPCAFDGVSIESSGIQFPNPGSPPSVFTQITAPPGSYSFLCLLHAGMQIPLNVVADGTAIPTPVQVAHRTQFQVGRAITRLAPVADARAQQVTVAPIGWGHIRWTISAGGFYKGASANEFINSGLSVHVGDKVHINGNFEIHTATVPASAAATVPFLIPECEGSSGDTPPPCSDPSAFELAANPMALLPTAWNGLRNPNFFRNSGLLAGPSTGFTFVARAPGTYTMVCLVHGPEMSTTITVAG